MLVKRFQSAFTLIELLITVVIVAVLAVIAAPSFNVMLANTQIRTAAQGLLDGLQLARAEAIRRNGRVVFTKETGSGWTVSGEDGAVTVQTRSGDEGSAAATVTVTPNNATKLTFNSLGRVVGNTDESASITQLDIDVPTTVIPAASSKELRITITTGGAMRLCDPNGATGSGMEC